MNNTDNGVDQQMSERNLAVELEQEIAVLQRKDRKRRLVLGGIAAVVLLLGAAAYGAAGPDTALLTGSGGNARYQLTSQGGAPSDLIAGGSCCSSNSTGSNSTGGNSTSGQLSITQLHQLALVQFEKDTGNKPAKGVVNDFGCHIQIDIFDASGTIVGAYGYRGEDSLYRIK